MKIKTVNILLQITTGSVWQLSHKLLIKRNCGFPQRIQRGLKKNFSIIGYLSTVHASLKILLKFSLPTSTSVFSWYNKKTNTFQRGQNDYSVHLRQRSL